MTSHPILAELSGQLPESAYTFQYIQKAAEFEEIAAQAQKDISNLENLMGSADDGRSAKSFLEQSGYREWLNSSDEDERLRVLGTLRLIADVSEDLAED
jgi:hypothetical protein